MNREQTPVFRPGLETLEDRFLLSRFRSIFFPAPQPPAPPAPGTGLSASTIATLANPTRRVTDLFAVVPTQISITGPNTSPPVKLSLGVDPGLTTPGLIDPATLAADRGLTTPGLPTVAVTPHTTTPQITGLFFNADGTVGGLFP
jgi:hypothetical protein